MRALHQTGFVGVLWRKERILPSLRAQVMLRREKFMVHREGQVKESEAREEPAAFICGYLRRIRNRYVRRPQK